MYIIIIIIILTSVINWGFSPWRNFWKHATVEAFWCIIWKNSDWKWLLSYKNNDISCTHTMEFGTSGAYSSRTFWNDWCNLVRFDVYVDDIYLNRRESRKAFFFVFQFFRGGPAQKLAEKMTISTKKVAKHRWNSLIFALMTFFLFYYFFFCFSISRGGGRPLGPPPGHAPA